MKEGRKEDMRNAKDGSFSTSDILVIHTPGQVGNKMQMTYGRCRNVVCSTCSSGSTPGSPYSPSWRRFSVVFLQ
jgi:hypothetical protein